MTPLLTEDTNPLAELDRWYEEARAKGEPMPEAMTLATCAASGQPSARVVLYKAQSRGGLEFYTHYDGRKGRELAENPRVALVFYWPLLARQIRVEGTVERLSAEESDYYWATRPRESRLASLSSRQSEPLPNRQALELGYEQACERFRGQPIPRPSTWGGFRVLPLRIEFWVDRPWRLHDRFLYEYVPEAAAWRFSRLAP